MSMDCATFAGTEVAVRVKEKVQWFEAVCESESYNQEGTTH